MAIKVTRCPHCQTSFRVREEQLDAARGMVRCGSCLQVFRAADYFQSDNLNTATATTTNKATVTSAEEKPVKASSAQTSQTIASSSKKAEPTKPTPTKGVSNDDDFGLIHDDMDDEPISELMSDDPAVDFNLRTPSSGSRGKKSDALVIDTSIFESSGSTSFFFDHADDEDSPGDSSEEAWAAALLESSDDDTPVHEPAAASMLTAKREKDDFTGFVEDEEEESIDLDGSAYLSKLTLDIPRSPVNKVAGLQAEPLSLDDSNSVRKTTWGWLGGILILLIIAASQVLYFNFDSWARTPQWRPFYTQVCTYLDCSLPKIQNINNMATQHLVVQTHPKLKGALMIDTLLYNKADYTQPFPDLLLVFRDLNERVIASRRFTPKQYLSGELAGQSDMTPKSHTHIAIEIVDPGPEALSYHIDLLANH